MSRRGDSDVTDFDECDCSQMGWKKFGVLFIFAVGVTALIIGAIALSTINSYIVRTTVSETVLPVRGFCPFDTSIPVRLSKTGGMLLVQIPKFTCDGTANTSLVAPLYIDLPTAFRPKTWTTATTAYTSIDSHDADGEPWVSKVVPFNADGTIQGSTVYLTTNPANNVPRIYMGFALDDSEIGAETVYGPAYDVSLEYEAYVNGAPSRRSVLALAVGAAVAMLV